MERYSYTDMLSNVMSLHPKTSRNPKVSSPILVDPSSEKIRSPNSSARSLLTRDLSSLGFSSNYRIGMSSPHAGKDHKPSLEGPNKLSAFLNLN